MKKTVYYCDFCGKDCDYNEIYRIKVKSGSFINYANQDMWGADKKIIDICTNCIENIKQYIKEKE